MRRFYAPDAAVRQTVELSAEESHHARDVLRLARGDEVRLFDGAGAEYAAILVSLERKVVVAEIGLGIEPTAPESPLDLTVAAAVLQNEKYDLVVQKAVELGITTLAPVLTVRSDIKVSDPKRKLERWRRIALDATKQSGRARLMTIREPVDVKDLLASADAYSDRIFFSERDGGSLRNVSQPDQAIAVFGPKGGWDDTELAMARANGFEIVTLGGRILRAETAAIALTAVLQHRFGDIT